MAFSIESQTTQISNIFIDEYMPKAHPPYVMVYLYAYRHISNGNTSLTNQSIAEALDLLESDVVRSWKYWEKQGIVKLSENGNVHFLPIQSKKIEKTPTQKTQKPRIKIDEKPLPYTPKAIATINENSPTAKKLFSIAEQHLGRTLSYNDMNIVLSFNEWLRLPLEVIELLFTYCIENNHSHLNYIEKVAIGWAEQGITTIESALEFINLHQNGYQQIKKALGLNRMITPIEEEYIKKWVSEYGFSIEMIVTACEKAILQTGGNAKVFPYIDKILENWYQKNIKTKEDIDISDQKFQADKQNKKAEQAKKTQQKKTYSKQNTPVKRNRFVNYEQREWDFEELERLARERLKNS